MNFSKILASIDLSKNNTQIIKFCFKLAEELSSELSFLHCYHPSVNDIENGNSDIDEKHLNLLTTQAEDIGILHEEIDFSCVTHPGFASEGIPDFQQKQNSDLIIIGTSKNEYSLFGSGVAFNVLDKINCTAIVVPENFRLVDLNHIVFNLEFEFREIERIYDLLLFCDKIGAHLSCVHVCSKQSQKEATKNIETYKKMFEGHILHSVIDFELIIDEKYKSIEKYAVENEADIIVLGKTRKTWKNLFLETPEEKLGQKLNIPIMIIEI